MSQRLSFQPLLGAGAPPSPALLFTRFHRATIGGCRVASVLELLYQFSTY